MAPLISRDEAWRAVVDDYHADPQRAQGCKLGDQLIVRGDQATLAAPALYILGFNGGETAEQSAGAGDKQTRSARRWFDLCDRAALAVGVSSCGITERCHWGSPDIPTLVRRLGGPGELRRLLKLHAAANLAMFRETPPLVVWVTGLGYLQQTIEDYGLKPVAEAHARETPRKGVLWREYEDADGCPYLVSRHPTGARFATGEHDRVFQKLGELATTRLDQCARRRARAQC